MPNEKLLEAAVAAKKAKDDGLASYRQSVKAAYLDGHSAYAIAKALGVEIRAVLGVLDRLGVPRRQGG